MTYPNPNIDIMGVNMGPQVLADPLLAQELFEELGAVLQIISTDTPLPSLAVLQAGRVVARAALHAPRAASFRQCV